MNDVSSTLDLFTVVSIPKSYPYIDHGEFWLGYKLMRMLALNGTQNSLTRLRLHIFTDTKWIVEQGQEQGYFMYDTTQPEYQTIDKRFRAQYKHKSRNSFEYEYLCFYRWHLFRRAIDTWQDAAHPIENIMSVDSDVILLMNPFEYYHKSLDLLQFHNHSDFELVVVGPGD